MTCRISTTREACVLHSQHISWRYCWRYSPLQSHHRHGSSGVISNWRLSDIPTDIPDLPTNFASCRLGLLVPLRLSILLRIDKLCMYPVHTSWLVEFWGQKSIRLLVWNLSDKCLLIVVQWCEFWFNAGERFWGSNTTKQSTKSLVKKIIFLQMPTCRKP